MGSVRWMHKRYSDRSIDAYLESGLPPLFEPRLHLRIVTLPNRAYFVLGFVISPNIHPPDAMHTIRKFEGSKEHAVKYIENRLVAAQVATNLLIAARDTSFPYGKYWAPDCEFWNKVGFNHTRKQCALSSADSFFLTPYQVF